MMRFAPLALSLLLVCPAVGQRMGMANTNAPTVQQSIKFAGDKSFSLTYTAITWARGQMMDAAMSKEGGEARARINATAERAPLGSLTTSQAFTLGGKQVPAGDYNLMFTIDNDMKWHLIAAAKKGDTRVDWPLDLKSSNHNSKRLLIQVMPGEEDTEGQLRIAFGEMETTVGFQPGGEDEGEEGKEENDK